MVGVAMPEKRTTLYLSLVVDEFGQTIYIQEFNEATSQTTNRYQLHTGDYNILDVALFASRSIIEVLPDLIVIGGSKTTAFIDTINLHLPHGFKIGEGNSTPVLEVNQ